MPRSTPRHALLLLLSLSIALTGCWCGPGRVDSAVPDVPVTLEQVKALDKPPERTVSIKRERTDKGGGVGCAHHPVCLIVLPVVVYSALFPEKHDKVVITENGHVTYEARFSTEGWLLDATATAPDGSTRLLRGLHMKELGKTQVVEHARVPKGAKEAIPTPLLPQVDLPAEYRAAMQKASKGEKKAKLLLEALAMLGPDATALMVERLSDPAEADEAKLEVVLKACDSMHAPHHFTQFKEPALAALEKGPGPMSGLAALRCSPGSTPEVKARRTAITTSLARALCNPATEVKEGTEPLAGFTGGAEWSKEALPTELLRACAEPLTREVLRALMHDSPPTRAELDAAFASKRPEKNLLARRLDPGDAGHRAALLRAMAAGAIPQSFLWEVTPATRPASDEEARLLADVLVANHSENLTNRTCSRALLELLAAMPPAHIQAARERLHQALDKEHDSSERAVLRVGLVLLGEREHALPASRPFKDYEYNLRDAQANAASCVAVGLVIAGCSEEDLRPLTQVKERVSDRERGPLCTRASAVAGASVP